MEKFRRIFVVVMDSLGVGEAEDAAQFGDVGSNTLGHISQSVSYTHLTLPTNSRV